MLEPFSLDLIQLRLMELLLNPELRALEFLELLLRRDGVQPELLDDGLNELKPRLEVHD